MDFIYENMPRAIFFEEQFNHLKYSLNACREGLIADAMNQKVHGFDSFQGLPEDWEEYTDSSLWFWQQGKAPTVRKNVRLHVGLFNETLPEFLWIYSEDFAFIHIDCDLYSSTKTIFGNCSPRIKPGTRIVFDEFFNYPNWQQHEYKAFKEYAESNGIDWKYIGYSRNQVAVEITGFAGKEGCHLKVSLRNFRCANGHADHAGCPRRTAEVGNDGNT